jgi:beta-lactamase class A
MKLLVGAAVLGALDSGILTLSDRLTLTAKDISPGPEELANTILREGSYTTTVEELLTRAVADSDSTAVDALIEKIGGISSVQNFLTRHGLKDLRVDRLERDLQAESLGLSWRLEFSDLTVFERAVSAIKPEERTRTWRSHLADPRDKGTPIGMTAFLHKLVNGTLLSQTSTETLLSIMERTATGKNRLRAGLPATWKVAHKTGTGRSWDGVIEAVNDVGIVTNMSGERVIVAVFLAEYRGELYEGEGCIASVAELLGKNTSNAFLTGVPNSAKPLLGK